MNIFSLTYSDLEQYFGSAGKAKLVYNYLYKNKPHGLNIQLEQSFDLGGVNIVQTRESENAAKFLYELHDGNTVEAVLMRHKYGNALCVSTQVGCNMGCRFCRSGRYGKVRNLEPYEMVLQLTEAQKHIKEEISRVTLMGIGEPLDNLENVVTFISIVGHRHGLAVAPRHLTLSTVGLPAINKLHDIPCNLAVSLHAPNDGLRSRLIPANKAFGISELLAAVGKYSNVTGKKVTLEYVLLGGVNDSDECARELAVLAADINCYINVIAYNETGLGFKRSGRLREFYSMLIQSGVRAVVRKEFAGELNAACGQLRSK